MSLNSATLNYLFMKYVAFPGKHEMEPPFSLKNTCVDFSKLFLYHGFRRLDAMLVAL